MKTKLADVAFYLTFYLSHFNISNQIENEAIEHVFKMYLVRSDEVESVWKKLHKILFMDQKYF